jgi:hypothetical protein
VASITPALAAGTTEPTINDADDSAGKLDIKTASLAQDASNVTVSFTTYAPFTNDDIGLIDWAFDVGNDGDNEYGAAVLVDDEGNLFGGAGPTGGPDAAEGTVTRPTPDSLQMVFPTSAIGGNSGYGWALAAFDIDGEEDVAPDDAAGGLPGEVVRLSGDDRIETAIATSQDFFTENDALAVVLARADQFADALAGTPLAVAKFGPLLLQPPGPLDQRVSAEIDRVLDENGEVHILGGPAALDPSLDAALQAKGYDVFRHAGNDRYETAVAIADAVSLTPSSIMLTTGTNFPDALAAGAAAAIRDGVVLLTAGTTMAPATAAYRTAHSGVDTYAIGGPAATAAPDAIPLVGADRYATARLVAVTLFEAPIDIGIASGTSFADALAGGAHIGGLGPLLLTDPGTLSPPTAQFLESRRGSLDFVFIYGGPAAVSSAVEAAIRTIVE